MTRKFVLAMFAMMELCSVSFGQDCSSGTCQRPVVAAAKKIVAAPVVVVQSITDSVSAVVQAAPVRTVVRTTVRQRPVRSVLRKVFCR